MGLLPPARFYFIFLNPLANVFIRAACFVYIVLFYRSNKSVTSVASHLDDSHHLHHVYLTISLGTTSTSSAGEPHIPAVRYSPPFQSLLARNTPPACAKKISRAKTTNARTKGEHPSHIVSLIMDSDNNVKKLGSILYFSVKEQFTTCYLKFLLTFILFPLLFSPLFSFSPLFAHYGQ
jgi:hypothetical protein